MPLEGKLADSDQEAFAGRSAGAGHTGPRAGANMSRTRDDRTPSPERGREVLPGPAPPEAAPLRVLHFSNAEARGGAEEHMLTLLRGLDRRRFKLYLACPAPLLSCLPDLPPDVTVVTRAPLHAWHARTGWRLARFLRRERIQLVHAHLSCASRAIAPWVLLARTPLFLETTHVREDWRRGWKRLACFDRLADRCLDGYIAVSAANADYLRDEKRLPHSKVWTIRNGIDLRRFAVRPTVSEDPRPGMGIAPGELLLVCAARLEPQKGHAVLLHAMAELPAVPQPRIRLVCLGEGRLGNELRLLARGLGLESRVLFAGFSPNVPAWLAVADIFVLPSLYEGLPLAAIEAAAAGCPVVATAVDGTPEVVRHGETGLLVPSGDAGALALAIRRLVGDPRLRKAMGEAGQAWVSRRFDQQRQISATGELYVELWHRRGDATATAAGVRRGRLGLVRALPHRREARPHAAKHHG